MKITPTLAAFSTVALLLAGPAAWAQQDSGAGASPSDMPTESQGAPSSGTSGSDSTGAMGGSSPGSSAQSLSSDQIREVQQALKDKGHDVGAIDGMWGPQTENALKEYQQAEGMSASGELDAQTLSSLGVSGSAVGAPGAGEQQPQSTPDAGGSPSGGGTSEPQSAPDAGGAPSGGGTSEDTSPGAGVPTPAPDAGGASGGGGTGEDAGPGAASGGRGY